MLEVPEQSRSSVSPVDAYWKINSQANLLPARMDARMNPGTGDSAMNRGNVLVNDSDASYNVDCPDIGSSSVEVRAPIVMIDEAPNSDESHLQMVTDEVNHVPTPIPALAPQLSYVSNVASMDQSPSTTIIREPSSARQFYLENRPDLTLKEVKQLANIEDNMVEAYKSNHPKERLHLDMLTRTMDDKKDWFQGQERDDYANLLWNAKRNNEDTREVVRDKLVTLITTNQLKSIREGEAGDEAMETDEGTDSIAQVQVEEEPDDMHL